MRTHQSEVGKLVEVYINPVQNAFGDPNKLSQQWEELFYHDAPDYPKAVEEYKNFEQILVGQGIKVSHFEADPNIKLDGIYARDAAIATDHGVIICNMGKEGRKGEPAMQRRVFEANGVKILGEITNPGTVEGGDVAWLDKNTLAVGHSYRTNEEGIEQLTALLEPKGIDVIPVDMPYFRGPDDILHLMSILSPVDHDLAVVYSPIMPISFRKLLIDLGYNFIEVPDSEYDSMGPNVLAIAPRVCLMVDGNPETEKRLKEAGCEVIKYKGDEISVKGTGGPTCLTRPMIREV